MLLIWDTGPDIESVRVRDPLWRQPEMGASLRWATAHLSIAGQMLRLPPGATERANVRVSDGHLGTKRAVSATRLAATPRAKIIERLPIVAMRRPAWR